MSPDSTCDPDRALAPDQPPPAVQLVALLDDHVTVDDPPVATLSGLAASVTVGAGGGGDAVTATVTDAPADPPVPVQARVYAAVSVRPARFWDPDRALLPDQPPPAAQLVASVDDHVSVDDPPAATLSGFAVSVAWEAGGGAAEGGATCVTDGLT